MRPRFRSAVFALVAAGVLSAVGGAFAGAGATDNAAAGEAMPPVSQAPPVPGPDAGQPPVYQRAWEQKLQAVEMALRAKAPAEGQNDTLTTGSLQ